MNGRTKLHRVEKLKTHGPCSDAETRGADSRFSHYFYLEDPRTFRRRYGLVIGAELVTGCLTIAMTSVLLLTTYFSNLAEHQAAKMFFFGCLVIGLVFFFAKIEVICGRVKLVWINAGIYLICLLISLTTIAYRPPTTLYFIALLSPLVGLLILNSHRCRELRQKSHELRLKRQAITAILKQR
jgi:hypothetical protein